MQINIVTTIISVILISLQDNNDQKIDTLTVTKGELLTRWVLNSHDFGNDDDGDDDDNLCDGDDDNGDDGDDCCDGDDETTGTYSIVTDNVS